jgi:hypothetical protein
VGSGQEARCLQHGGCPNEEMNRLEQGSLALFCAGVRREPLSAEENVVGFCSECESELISLAYHKFEAGWMVSARCKNGHLVLMRYDLEWNWLDDSELEICAEATFISSISREKLEAVFTRAEIRDMEACEKGQPFTRQNLYRARAKYDRFEKLFGIKIKI